MLFGHKFIMPTVPEYNKTTLNTNVVNDSNRKIQSRLIIFKFSGSKYKIIHKTQTQACLCKHVFRLVRRVPSC